MFALTLPQRLLNLCSAIRETLGQRQIRQSPGLALNAHSGNEWGKIPVLTGYWSVHLITPSTTAPLLWNDLPVHTFFFPLPFPLLACLHTSQAPLHSLLNPNYSFKT